MFGNFLGSEAAGADDAGADEAGATDEGDEKETLLPSSCVVTPQSQRMSRDAREDKDKTDKSTDSVLGSLVGGKQPEPTLPALADLSELLDKCINLVDREEVQNALKLAGSKKEDLQEVLLQILMQHDVPPDLALYATSAAYSSRDAILQGKVESLLQEASKYWHLGYFEEQKKIVDECGGRIFQLFMRLLKLIM